MKTALIIDDHAEFRATLGGILHADGWLVMEADDGESGLEIVRQRRPQVVLCDLLMPRGNGFQVCRAIRADISLPPTKIIVVSGRNLEGDRNAALEAGADEYLNKPVSAETVIRVISKWGGDKDEQLLQAEGGLSSSVHMKFWGVRGSIPSPGPDTVGYGGNTSCIEVRCGSEVIVLDAGTGIRGLGRALMGEFAGRPLNVNLLLTHTHWDHIQGLPFFGPVYQPDCHLRIFGCEGARKSLVHILCGQMESQYFPVPFQELPGNIEIQELRELQFQIGAVRVEACYVNHPGICVGYRLFTGDGSIVYIPDHEPHCRHRFETVGSSPGDPGSMEFLKAEEKKLISFLSGADVLVLDSQYDRDEYQTRVGWGHSCVDDAVAIALRAGVKKLFLFHHDPDHSDEKISAMVVHGRQLVADHGAKLEVEAATEGAVIKLALNSPRPI